MGAWNPDGNGKGVPDNGLDALHRALQHPAPRPHPDTRPFRPPDRALHLERGSGLLIADSPRLHFKGTDPIAFSFWLRPTAGTSSAYAEILRVEDLVKTFASVTARCVKPRRDRARHPAGRAGARLQPEPLRNANGITSS